MTSRLQNFKKMFSRKNMDDESSQQEEELPTDYAVGTYLENIPLLARLSKKERAQLGAALVLKRYSDGEAIIKEGDLAREFFLIDEGKCIILHFDEATGKDEKVAELSSGDYFGETALVSDETDTRGATAIAEGNVVCMTLTASKFKAMFGDRKFNVQFAKRQAISAEKVKEYSRASLQLEDVERDKPKATKDLILSAIKENLLFHNLSSEQKENIVNEMHKINISKGDLMIKQGEPGDFFYVVESGEFEVFVKRDGEENMVAVRASGTCVGELALMYNSPRAATVKAKTDATVWAIHRHMFRKIVTKGYERKIKAYEEFLKKIPVLSSLLSSERTKVAEALDEVSYLDNHVVCKQGEEGKRFFIVRNGEAVVTQENDGDVKEVERLTEGKFFGERALLTDEPRAATVTANKSLKCLVLDRKDFVSLLGPLDDIMKRKIMTYSKEGSCPTFTKDTAIANIPFTELTNLGTLGRGAFGDVKLVLHKKTGKTYALKAVFKSQIVAMGQEEHIMSEKSVMSQMNCSFIINLCDTYKDEKYVYFLLEVALGGELFNLLRSRNRFNEQTTRFYAACVIQAFEYMHERNIVYRDLKPENLLLDKEGYLKITDFGFAKVLQDDRTWTLCGTPDYLAPEVVSGQGHGKAVDWWTLGVLIYEMLASYPPFYSEDNMQVYKKIMSGRVRYPRFFSKNVIDLISKLLKPKPTKRLGVIKGGVDLIKKHRWFKGFDWDALQNRTMKAPIIPQIHSEQDLSNFDEYPEDNSAEEMYARTDGNTGWDAEF